jgi:hypothetical protein
MLFSDVSKTYPLMSLTDKNFSGRRRDNLEQACLQKNLSWSFRGLGIHRTAVKYQLLLSNGPRRFIPPTIRAKMALFSDPLISICLEHKSSELRIIAKYIP